MNKSKYQFDELDIQFLEYVQIILERYYKDEAPSVLAKSSLLKRLSEDPNYVHHYDEEYWAKYVYREYEQKKTNKRNNKNC
ncbi:hypothetical protein M3685_11650 [Heyndrickxia oleronia]|uniref:Uncharacterized protein n=1 Tax=Heyndrickxia oleronia TaxID=38875 RepID=A0A8E2IAU9_9BACI|nr:hypothetical protein [Heyndrickxia oleronia]OJH17191.1 hypothetical protein BLX88_19400 [Bacillus obstructivus]MCM3454596.1 hypothetical protein [Heyndrickxia oleronia]MEC1377308.1 hypothetical protein [Heyndrickxia oleronia]OOP66556.1 hypothetical protein BWZ43_20420 [Heyndrickxia oleronia]QQZ03901.1 hypothetical protein I5818_19530 [Heyndrickxia oleronia]